MASGHARTKTKVLEFYGGPGIGKSTLAAKMYVYLKERRCDAELVREFVREFAWHQYLELDQCDQLFAIAQQMKRELALFGNVKYLVTDGPVLMNYIYALVYPTSLPVRHAAKAQVKAFYKEAKAKGVQHIPIIINRVFAYDKTNREPSLKKSKVVDGMIASQISALHYAAPIILADAANEDAVAALFQRLRKI